MSRRCFYIICTTVLVAFGGFLSSDGVTQAAQIGIYWTTWWDHTLRHAELDGSDIQTLVTQSSDHLGGISLDPLGQKVYWGVLNGRIYKANLDGSDVQQVYNTSSSLWNIDVSQGVVYCKRSSEVARVDTNGTNYQQLVSTTSREALVYDPEHGHVYYQDTGDVIMRINADGSGVPVQILTSGTYSGFISSLALDPVNEKLYLADANGPGQRILRSNLDGSDLELVADVQGSDRIYGLSIDPAGEVIYYGNWDGTIGRVNFDGSNDVVLLKDGDGPIYALDVIVPEPATLGLLLLGGLALLRRRRYHSSSTSY